MPARFRLQGKLPPQAAGNVCERPQHGALYTNSVTPAGGALLRLSPDIGMRLLFQAPLPGLVGAAHASSAISGAQVSSPFPPPRPLPPSALARGEDQSEGKQGSIRERSTWAKGNSFPLSQEAKRPPGEASDNLGCFSPRAPFYSLFLISLSLTRWLSG